MGKVPVPSSLSKRCYHRSLLKSILNLTQQWSPIINFSSKNSPVVPCLYQHMFDSLESQQPQTHMWLSKCPVSPNCLMMKSYPPSCKNSSLCPELRSQSFPPLSWHWADTVLRCVYGADKVNKCHSFPSLSPERGITSGRLVSIQRITWIVDWERKPHGRLIALLRSLNKE